MLGLMCVVFPVGRAVVKWVVVAVYVGFSGLGNVGVEMGVVCSDGG